MVDFIGPDGWEDIKIVDGRSTDNLANVSNMEIYQRSKKQINEVVITPADVISDNEGPAMQLI